VSFRQNSQKLKMTSCGTWNTAISWRPIRSAEIRFLRLKNGDVIRPAANRNTVKALEDRGLIQSAKGREPLTLVWRLKKKSS
jgi:hypothetical protein